MFKYGLLILGILLEIVSGRHNSRIFSHEKRLTIPDNSKLLWTNGIIPYMFDDSLSETKRTDYLAQTFPLYEKYSCIRFVRWTSEVSSVYKLDHNNYLRFIESRQCESKIGNTGGSKQTISCCGWRTCIHELGHALGLYHEQTSPIRNDYVRINPENIVAGLFSQFDMRFSNVDTHDIYDYDSIMHYGQKAWSKNQEPTISFIDPDVKPIPNFANTDQYFYYFKEINELYHCADDCDNLRCENGGYKAIVNDKCQCRCPDGLNPQTQCSTLTKLDYNCGKIITLDDNNSNVVIESPTIKSNKLVTCNWYIKSPLSTRILLNFPLFKIRQQFEECVDEISVKQYLPGLYGIPYCGNIFKKTVQSESNILAFSFTQSVTQSTGSAFVAKVSFVKESDYCYNLTGRGVEYSGTIRWAEDSTPCLPWDRVSKCPHSLFNINDDDKRLENNYCRNPDNSLKPWCYTNTDGCIRKVCDVCNFGICKDIYTKCNELINKDPLYCSTSDQAPRQCRRSCGWCEQHIPLTSVPKTHCGRPILPSDAVPITTKSEYNVGDILTVVCNSNNNDHQHMTCLSDGTWSSLNYVCGTCMPGWQTFGNSCYKLMTNKFRYEFAAEHCSTHYPGAILVVETRDNHDFLSELIKNRAGVCTEVWIGLKKQSNSNEFAWTSGKIATWTNWASEDRGNNECVSINKDCKWTLKWCKGPQKFVCSYVRNDSEICADQRNDCGVIKKRNPSLCITHEKSFAMKYCAKTCNLCTK